MDTRGTVRTFEMPRVERVLEGQGALGELQRELERRGLKRAMLLTGRSVANLPEVAALRTALESHVAASYDKVQAHNPTAALDELLATGRSVDADVLIAIGGGSPIDAAKLVAVALSEDLRSAAELKEYSVVAAAPPLRRRPLPVIAVPTTLSAAEWNGTAAFTVEAENTKYLVRYLQLTPATVVLDPKLASYTPRNLWITTGVRAIDHAVETVYARDAHPYATGLALAALTLLAANLPASGREPGSFSATLACQRAAEMSLICTHNVSLGLSHAIGHQLGALGVPHGVTSCVMLPHVMRYFEPASTSAQAQIASALARGQDDDKRAISAADRLEMLLTDLGVPRRLRDCRVTADQLEGVVAATMTEAPIAIAAAPRDDVDAAAVRALLKAAY